MIIDPNAEPMAESLPDYDAAIRGAPQRHPPQAPVIYTFTDWAQSAMLLIPPRDALNQSPLYRITVELDLNPFLPVSFVTKVFRCEGDDSGLVGEFALALNNKRSVIRLGDTTTRLSNVIYTVNSSPKHFNWFLGHRLRWDCRQWLDDGSPVCICYLPSPPPQGLAPSSRQPDTDTIQIASFVPPPPDSSPPLPEATLTIFPHGHSLMDEILVSALVVERMLTR